MLGSSLNSFFYRLDKKLNGKLLLLGIGNCLRGDDGFGSELAKLIKDKVSIKVLDTQMAPENFLGVILKERPNMVLFVDAVDFGGNIGDVKLFNLKTTKTKNFFLTHNTSPSLLFEFLKNHIHAELYLLAIQPKDISFGQDMSPEIKERLLELKNYFLERYYICD